MGSVMLSSSPTSQLMVLQRLLRPAPLLFLKNQTTSFLPITNNSFPGHSVNAECFMHRAVLRFRTFSNNPAVSTPQDILEFPDDVDNDDDDVEIEKENNGQVFAERKPIVRGKVPSLTVKEKKELGSYAHSLGKKLKSQQVGKSGVTDNVIFALDETLEANELLKLKIHGSCPGGELEDIVKHLEEATGSVVVGQIGRTVILYRPSLTKMKAEEKKKQAQIAFLKKQSAFRQSFQGKSGQVPRPYARGRRGSSRV